MKETTLHTQVLWETMGHEDEEAKLVGLEAELGAAAIFVGGVRAGSTVGVEVGDVNIKCWSNDSVMGV